MYRIAQSHTRQPMLAFLLQEHHLTRTKAIEIRAKQVAKNLGLMYLQADRPPGEAKGGAAIVIPLNMIDPKPKETAEEAHRRVAASLSTTPDGRMVSVTTLINGSEITLTSVYAPVYPPDRTAFFTGIKPRLTKSHLIGMDANCVFNPAIDVSRPDGTTKPPDTAGTAELHSALADNDLTDIAREALGDIPYHTHTKALQGGVDITQKRTDHIHTPNLDAITWRFVPHPPDILPYQTYGHNMQQVDLIPIKETRGRDLPFITEDIFDDPQFNATVANKINDLLTEIDPGDGEWGEAWERIKVEATDTFLQRTTEKRKEKDMEAESIRETIL